MILRAFSLGYIGAVYDSFADDTTYLDLDWVIYFARLVENFNAFNAVLTFLKLFKFVRENRRMSQLIDTVQLAAVDMGGPLHSMVLVGAADEVERGLLCAFCDAAKEAPQMDAAAIEAADAETLANAEAHEGHAGGGGRIVF